MTAGSDPLFTRIEQIKKNIAQEFPLLDLTPEIYSAISKFAKDEIENPDHEVSEKFAIFNWLIRKTHKRLAEEYKEYQRTGELDFYVKEYVWKILRYNSEGAESARENLNDTIRFKMEFNKLEAYLDEHYPDRVDSVDLHGLMDDYIESVIEGNEKDMIEAKKELTRYLTEQTYRKHVANQNEFNNDVMKKIGKLKKISFNKKIQITPEMFKQIYKCINEDSPVDEEKLLRMAYRQSILQRTINEYKITLTPAMDLLIEEWINKLIANEKKGQEGIESRIVQTGLRQRLIDDFVQPTPVTPAIEKLLNQFIDARLKNDKKLIKEARQHLKRLVTKLNLIQELKLDGDKIPMNLLALIDKYSEVKVSLDSAKNKIALMSKKAPVHKRLKELKNAGKHVRAGSPSEIMTTVIKDKVEKRNKREPEEHVIIRISSIHNPKYDHYQKTFQSIPLLEKELSEIRQKISALLTDTKTIVEEARSETSPKDRGDSKNIRNQ